VVAYNLILTLEPFDFKANMVVPPDLGGRLAAGIAAWGHFDKMDTGIVEQAAVAYAGLWMEALDSMGLPSERASCIVVLEEFE